MSVSDLSREHQDPSLTHEMSGLTNFKFSSTGKFSDAARELRKLLMKQVRKALLGGSRIVVVVELCDA